MEILGFEYIVENTGFKILHGDIESLEIWVDEG